MIKTSVRYDLYSPLSRDHDLEFEIIRDHVRFQHGITLTSCPIQHLAHSENTQTTHYPD